MRDYARIAPTFWTRGSGKRLRGDKEAQVVALYLMSSPATSMVGIFNLSLATLCNDTGLSPKEARKGLVRCSEEAIAYLDEADELAWVPALARYQLGESLSPGKNGKKADLRIAGVRRALEPFKGHKFYSMFLDRYADAYCLGNADPEGACEGLESPSVRARNAPAPVLVPDPDSGATRSKRWRRVPKDWEPNAKHREMAAKLGVDFQLELETFRDHEFDKPKSDADAAFSNWIRRGAKFGSIPSAPPETPGESESQRKNRERIEAERAAQRQRDAAEAERRGLTKAGDPKALLGGIGG